MSQMVKNLPAMLETWVQSLGQEDPLEEGRATHSSILAWIIPWTEEPGGLQSMESQRTNTTEPLSLSTLILRTILSIWLIKPFSTVEIESNQLRPSKGYLFRDCNSKGVCQHFWGLADTQRQAEKWESFVVDREEGSRCAWLETVGMEATGRLATAQPPPPSVRGAYLLSPVGPKLGVVAKIREAIRWE